VRPYTWIAAVLLFLSYVIGLWFTLRTHAAVIWNNESDEKKVPDVPQVPIPQPLASSVHARLQRHGSTQNSSSEVTGIEIRDSQLYKRILGQSLRQVGLDPREDGTRQSSLVDTAGPNGSVPTPHLPPPKSSGAESVRSEIHIPGFTDAQNTSLVREVAEIAATAATLAARDATKAPRRTSLQANAPVQGTLTKVHAHKPGVVHDHDEHVAAEGQEGGGHDAPNWSRMKSSVILCGATVLYALIAEILVGCVDVILQGSGIDEKFLGITLFALVPNTTEFLVSKDGSTSKESC
jgi:Ca2+:H+ antiporter